MDLSKKRCSECGEGSYKKKLVLGRWNHPWKDFPSVFLMEEVSIWICSNCKNVASVKGDAEKLDRVIEDSIKEQVSQFIQIIRSKAEVNNEQIASLIGISPTYLASLHSKKKVPSFTLWNELKMIAISPEEMIEKLDPSWDLKNLLLRA